MKIDALCRLFDTSKSVVFFTGAGISTSAHIPDYRGTNGLYSRQLPLVSIGSFESDGLEFAKPTFSHLFIARLIREGRARAVVTSNHDGLHNKAAAGMDDTVVDVFGNVFVERCAGCARLFRRATITPNIGRRCEECGGRLAKTGTRMGAETPREPLERATREAQAADLAIVLGSSMTISPFCELPGLAKKFILVTLQPTSYDARAALVIHAFCDEVMAGLARHLYGEGWAPTAPIIQRTVVLSVSADGVLEVRASEPQEAPTMIAEVHMQETVCERDSKGRLQMEGVKQGAELTIKFARPLHFEDQRITVGALPFQIELTRTLS